MKLPTKALLIMQLMDLDNQEGELTTSPLKQFESSIKC